MRRISALRVLAMYLDTKLAPGQTWTLKGALRLYPRGNDPIIYLSPNGRLYPYEKMFGDEVEIIPTKKVKVLEFEQSSGTLLDSMVIEANGKKYYFGSKHKGRPRSTTSVPSGYQLQKIFDKQVGGSRTPAELAEAVGAILGDVVSAREVEEGLHRGAVVRKRDSELTWEDEQMLSRLEKEVPEMFWEVGYNGGPVMGSKEYYLSGYLR